MKEDHEDGWLKSKEVEQELQISSCDLMHLRTAGKLQFQKKGNAFFYNPEDVNEAKKGAD